MLLKQRFENPTALLYRNKETLWWVLLDVVVALQRVDAEWQMKIT